MCMRGSFTASLKRRDQRSIFTVVVRKDNARVTELKQLAGQRICSMDPPNLGTLAVLEQFDNPARQPVIMNSIGWNKAYEGVAFDKKCAAAIVPMVNLKKFSNNSKHFSIV